MEFLNLEKEYLLLVIKRLNYSFPKSSHAKKTIRKPVTISDAISDLPKIKNNENSAKYLSKPKTNYQKLMRKNAPDNLMDHKSSKHSENLVTIMSYLPEGGLKRIYLLKFDQSLDTQIATEGYGGINQLQLLLEILVHQVQQDVFILK